MQRNYIQNNNRVLIEVLGSSTLLFCASNVSIFYYMPVLILLKEKNWTKCNLNEPCENLKFKLGKICSYLHQLKITLPNEKYLNHRVVTCFAVIRLSMQYTTKFHSAIYQHKIQWWDAVSTKNILPCLFQPRGMVILTRMREWYNTTSTVNQINMI